MISLRYICGFIIIIGIFLLVSLIGSTTKTLIPISFFALLAGVFYESIRATKDAKSTLYISIASFIFSLFLFSSKNNEYNLNMQYQIEIWPYFYLGIYLLIFIIYFKEKITPKLTEGITLMQSIALIYWVIEQQLYTIKTWYMVTLGIITSVFIIISIFNAFTPLVLSNTNRFLLSLWSSIIMLIFAADNIYKIYSYEGTENYANINIGLYAMITYLLLGISSLYIAVNIIMLIGFLPDKTGLFNSDYFKKIRELRNEHIQRYSDNQVNPLYSLLFIIFGGSIFSLNYLYHFLPRNMIIWIVFVTFPIFLNITERLLLPKKNSYRSYRN